MKCDHKTFRIDEGQLEAMCWCWHLLAKVCCHARGEKVSISCSEILTDRGPFEWWSLCFLCGVKSMVCPTYWCWACIPEHGHRWVHCVNQEHKDRFASERLQRTDSEQNIWTIFSWLFYMPGRARIATVTEGRCRNQDGVKHPTQVMWA